MKYLIIALLAYVAVLGIGFVIDVSGIPVEYKFILVILVSIPFAVLVYKLSKRMSELENAVFVVFLVAPLAISWTLRDIHKGYFSLYTILVLVALVGGVARIVYLLIRRRREMTIHD